MKTSSCKAKGRRLQVFVAESLARACDLTIEASPPTKPGERNGVIWVSEGNNPDLRVRQMGQAGADVALLSIQAQQKVSLARPRNCIAPAHNFSPLHIECKNTEVDAWGRAFWKKGHSALIDGTLWQAQRSALPGWVPVAVLGRNRWPPVVAWQITEEEREMLGKIWSSGMCAALTAEWGATSLIQFITYFLRKEEM